MRILSLAVGERSTAAARHSANIVLRITEEGNGWIEKSKIDGIKPGDTFEFVDPTYETPVTGVAKALMYIDLVSQARR